MTLIKNSLANLKGHKLRLAIAFIWIIIGITSVIFVSSVANAMSDMVKSTFVNISPRVAKVYYQPGDESGRESNAISASYAISNSDIPILKTIDGVENIETSNLPPSTYSFSETPNADVSFYDRATSAGYFTSSDNQKVSIIKGRNITEEDEGRNVVVISSDVAKALDIDTDESKITSAYDALYSEGDNEASASSEEQQPKTGKYNLIGRAITVNGSNYQVIGIADSSKIYDKQEKKFRNASIFDDFAPSFLLFPNTARATLTNNFGDDMIATLAVKVKDNYDVSKVGEEVASTLQSLHPDITDGEYKVQDRSTIAKSTEEVTKGIDKFVNMVIIVAMILGGVGIMNIMYVSVMERTKEIGIRRALGAKPREILLQFIIESVFITSIGGVMGIVVGYFVTIFSKNYMPFKPIVSIDSILYSVIAIILTGIIFGLVPAVKASKLDPIKVIYK